MQNKEFKRVWERECRKLFAIQKRLEADSHRAAMKHRKVDANTILGGAGAERKAQRWHPAVQKLKRAIFIDM
ncbi:MAG: hypothetical protein M1321_00010 [Candidatus Marsarchaeota archaeon]|nr:hypothetical protein [Candidatus Marsarchaeota archaeon]